MGASDALFRATCATLGLVTLASGGWLAASMYKGYVDASEWEVRGESDFSSSSSFARHHPTSSPLSPVTAPAARHRRRCDGRSRSAQGRL